MLSAYLYAERHLVLLHFYETAQYLQLYFLSLGQSILYIALIKRGDNRRMVSQYLELAL